MSVDFIISFLRIEVFIVARFFERVANVGYFDILLASSAPLYPCWVVGNPLAECFPVWVVNLSAFVFGMCGVLTLVFFLAMLREAILMYRVIHAEDDADI